MLKSSYVSEWMPSERETDCRQRLLPAEAECTSILWERKRYIEMQSRCFANKYFTQTQWYFFKWAACSADTTFLPEFQSTQFLQCHLIRQERLCQKEELSKQCCSPNVFSNLSVRSEGILRTEHIREFVFRQLLQPFVPALTYRRHSTDAEGRSCRREAELIQNPVGPCRVNHCNIAAEGRARNYPHRTLAERDGYGVWKDEWHETTRRR